MKTQIPLAVAFKDYCEKIPGKFKPDKKFYALVGVNQKRFGQLLRGEKQLLVTEAKKLAEILEIEVTQLL